MKTTGNGNQRPTKNNSLKEKKVRNTEILVLTYFFVIIFVSLIGYLAYFQFFRGEDMANSPYNRKRLEQMAETVERGKIISADGEVLAETLHDEQGQEYRSYPYVRTFAHVVGYQMNGGSGLEAAFNVRLLRSNSFFLSRFSRALSGEKYVGDNIVTTLDTSLQEVAYHALGDNTGAVVVMRPKTGEVLAMVSKPDYNPNRIAENWDYFTSEEGKNDTSLLNRATQGLYPPGSTFKILTTLEYLKEHNDYYTDYQYQCEGHIDHNGDRINCYNNKVHGDLNLQRSFALSCNSSFVNIGLNLNRTKLYDLCTKFMFNRKFGLSLPSSQSIFTMNKDTDSYMAMQTVIGQGDTLVTPMHMAMIVSAIANNGTMMKPYFVDHVETTNGTVIKTYSPTVIADELLNQTEYAALREFMSEVVNDGTATSLRNEDYTVAGKTGSAEFGTEKGKSHSWFVCYAPAEDPEIAISVIVEGLGAGSDYAVPIAHKVLNEYFY